MRLGLSHLLKLEEIITLLDVSDDCTIAIISCNEPILCEEISNQIFSRVSDRIFIYKIEMDENSTDLVELLKEATKTEIYNLEKEKNKKISFFVSGLNKAIKKKNKEKSKILFHLNVKREEILEIKHSIIIWVDTESLSSIIKEAKDFFSWRTTVFKFDTRKDNVIVPIFDLEDSNLSLLNRKKLEKRMEYYSKLTEIYMEETPEASYNLVYCNYNLGKIQLLLGHANESIKYFDKLDSILKDINNKSLEESILVKLGDICLNLASIYPSNIEKSIKYYERSLKISRELGDHIIEQNNIDKLGSIYYQIGDIQTANKYYEQELKISGEFGNHREVGQDINYQYVIDGSEKNTNELNNLRSSPLLLDKQQAWNDLHRLTNNQDSFVRLKATGVLASYFSDLPDKQQAWSDLIRLTNDEDSGVKGIAIFALGSAFTQVPDKQQAWNELHRLTNDQDSFVRFKAVDVLISYFSELPDKLQAWNDLHRLTNNEDSLVRSRAVDEFGSSFSRVPDKQQAWNDLHKLTIDEDSLVRSRAVDALGSAFSLVPDKQQAWNDLHRLTNDQDKSVRSYTVEALGSAFSQVPNKQQAWNDLLRLINDEDSLVRSKAVDALGSAFSLIPDKQQAWNDLHRLTKDQDMSVRSCAALALGSVFSYVPDKQKEWNDLIELTNDEEFEVRSYAAKALGSAFSQVPDKQQAWNDLLRLTKDKARSVRSSSNHSLGRVSVFKASQAETDEDYKKELEKAIEYFEIASKESPEGMYNPSEFCLPFYRSFRTIIFKKQEAKEEIDRYLVEAKAAVKGSESKKQLIEAVQNLAEALKEVQDMGNLDLSGMKGELNFYRKYCDHAAELMKDTEKTAPFATMTLRKGLSVLDRNLKKLIEEIQEKAKIACKESQDTLTQEIAYAVSKEVRKWEIGSQEEMSQQLEDIAYLLKMKIADLPENEYVLNKIEAMKHERNLAKQYDTLLFVIGQIPTMKVISKQELDQKLQKFDRTFNEIICVKDKLNCISFDISKIKLNSADVILDLKTMKEELEKLSKIEGLNTLSIEKLDSTQAEKLNGLNNDILERLDEIKIIIRELSKDNDELYQEYSRKLDELKQSKLDTLLQRYSAAISLISFAISGIQVFH